MTTSDKRGSRLAAIAALLPLALAGLFTAGIFYAHDVTILPEKSTLSRSVPTTETGRRGPRGSGSGGQVVEDPGADADIPAPLPPVSGRSIAASIWWIITEASRTSVTLLPRDNARAANARTPFAQGAIGSARPFRFQGDNAQYARARDCLAAAQWYEAGNDPDGQRAVAQVVLNRVRHPAFSHTVCGVVFTGTERRTGCQFTFTCDGSLRRRPSAWAWEQARRIADEALRGHVFPRVGLATHYHTDWVYPLWSPMLVKLAAVDTHLFFRWPGSFGSAGAFAAANRGGEPNIAKMAFLSPAHRSDGTGGAPVSDVEAAEAVAIAVNDPAASVGLSLGAGRIVAVHPENDAFLIALDPSASPESYASLARDICGSRTLCRVMGWTDGSQVPQGFPPRRSLLDSMSYSYMRDTKFNFERSLWNCSEFRRSSPSQCMRNRNTGESPEPGPR